MNYKINKTLHGTFTVFEKNKLAPRAYAVPYASEKTLKKTPLEKERYSSDMVDLLSGTWDFKLYKSIHDLPDKLDSLKVKFKSIKVPADWQREGFLPPVYLNTRYEFKNMEPEVPADMPVGVYRRFFDVDDLEKTYIVSFLGVSNNLSLYVNGKFVGYSEGSHNTAEFDVSPYLSLGKNELILVSFRWCNGTFLECQDMFRDNGIFRDVLLYRYDKAYIWDFEALPEKTGEKYALNVKIWPQGDFAGKKVSAKLVDAKGKTVAEAIADAAELTEIRFEDLDVKEWNPELPTTYTLYLTLEAGKKSMTVRTLTGFKTIEIKDAVFYFNGQPVKFKGVNHHDTTLMNGFAMTHEDLIKDIKLMKSLNVNAVRTSHYPPDPFFLTLCDLYGLYVVDEADIETHGCWEFGDVSYISKQAKWVKHYLDRVRRMYYRDRSHVSVTMWSLGNESGGYKCHDACYKWLKETGTQNPVHYEGVVNTARMHYDVISEMYTSTEQIEQMMKGKRVRELDGRKWVCKEYSKFPFFLCEYAHAMGVGPGNLEEYWDLIYDWDISMGGCIWEWADHTVYHENGKYRYTYGGDHGEKEHDGNFCVDGLMFADRRLHTGAKEMKAVYRPLRASVSGNKLYCIENTNRFRASDYIGIRWILKENGIETDAGTLKTNIPPMGAECFEIRHKDFDPDKDAHLNFIYTDLETGEEIASEQLTLNDVPYEYDIEIGQKIGLSRDADTLRVTTENGELTFDMLTGELTSYVVNGAELLAETPALNRGFHANLYRALIDNDAANRDKWKAAGLNSLKPELTDIACGLSPDGVYVATSLTLRAGRKKAYTLFINYNITSLSAVEVTASFVPLEDAVVDTPRYGLTIELSRALDYVSYYGRGEAENMPDFKAQALIGIYSDRVENMREKYVFPQESGMHCDTKWLKLDNGKGVSLKFYAETSFNFSVKHFTQEALDAARHEEDLKDMNITLLSLDAATRGIGSSSCGPDTREEYRLTDPDGYEFSFTMIPEVQ